MKKNLLLYGALTLLSLGLFSGCASIVSQSQYPVALRTTPEGANVRIHNAAGELTYSGTTPTIVTLPAGNGYFRGKDYLVTFEKEGHSPATIPISRNLDGWYIGNILFGGLVGLLIVDPITGAMWRLSDDIHAHLPQLETAEDAEKLTIFTIDELSERDRETLVRIQ